MKVTRDAKDVYEMSLLPQNQGRNIISFCSAESCHSLGDRMDPIGTYIILHYIIGK